MYLAVFNLFVAGAVAAQPGAFSLHSRLEFTLLPFAFDGILHDGALTVSTLIHAFRYPVAGSDWIRPG